jgi:hypothetical protein
MNKNKPQKPFTENTKDDSSDVQNVKGSKQGPPPHPKAINRNNPTTEAEDTQKGHA